MAVRGAPRGTPPRPVASPERAAIIQDVLYRRTLDSLKKRLYSPEKAFPTPRETDERRNPRASAKMSPGEKSAECKGLSFLRDIDWDSESDVSVPSSVSRPCTPQTTHYLLSNTKETHQDITARKCALLEDERAKEILRSTLPTPTPPRYHISPDIKLDQGWATKLDLVSREVEGRRRRLVEEPTLEVEKEIERKRQRLHRAETEMRQEQIKELRRQHAELVAKQEAEERQKQIEEQLRQEALRLQANQETPEQKDEKRGGGRGGWLEWRIRRLLCGRSVRRG
ncbi:hypothetical protein AAMO2058_001702500 [Amorphochlora amoebiformis]